MSKLKPVENKDHLAKYITGMTEQMALDVLNRTCEAYQIQQRDDSFFITPSNLVQDRFNLFIRSDKVYKVSLG